jgi:uncharacterized Fe-S radical SAM superfamily protein PflX
MSEQTQNCSTCALTFPDCGKKRKPSSDGYCRTPWKPKDASVSQEQTKEVKP